MSSKLKKKGKTPKAPLSNKAMQEFRMAAFATKEHLEMAEQQMKMQIKKDVYQQLQEEIIPAIREEIEQDTWNESDEWTTLVNTCTFLTSLAELYGFGAKRMMKVVQQSNGYVEQVNEGKLSLIEMINRLEKKKVMFDDKYKEMVAKYQQERIVDENTA